jgi:DNA-binding CsgD family transcriptional regulator
MTADLALAADPDIIERSADPVAFVVQACQRAKAWLTEALEHGGIEQIAEIKSQAEAVRVYTTQKQLGKDAQLAAAEIVRRAERGMGLAIRRGQHAGQIAKRGDRGGRGAPGVHGGNPGDRRGDHLDSPAAFFRHGDERAETYTMTDGVSDSDFENALDEAKAEGNLSRANIVRKIRSRRGNATTVNRQVPDPADRSPEAATNRRELIGELAASGMTSRQIGAQLGISDERVRRIARQHGISIQADAALGRTRRLDSSRIVRETVYALEGLAMGIELADVARLDPAEAGEWAASMTRSLRVLSRFLREMKETVR